MKFMILFEFSSFNDIGFMEAQNSVHLFLVSWNWPVHRSVGGPSHGGSHWTACDMMVLGSIVKGAALAGIYPIPISPHHEMTFNHLATSLRQLKTMSYCEFQPYSLSADTDTIFNTKSITNSIDTSGIIDHPGEHCVIFTLRRTIAVSRPDMNKRS